MLERKGTVKEHEPTGLEVGDGAVWEATYEAVRLRTAALGRMPVPAGGSDDRRLYCWLRLQLASHRRGLLPVDQAASLAQLDGAFRGGFHDEQWWSRYRELKSFQAATGRNPRKSDGPDTLPLHAWLRRQRYEFGRGQLSEARSHALSSIEWALPCPPAEKWQPGLDRFVLEHGRLPRPKAEEPAERRLAGAVGRHKLIHPAFPEGYAGTLAQLSWEEHLQELTTWHAGNGRLPSRRAEDPGERRLAHFVNRQRRDHAAGVLPEKRRNKLKVIPGVLKAGPRKQTSEDWQRALNVFVDQTGRLPQGRVTDPAERALSAARYRLGLEPARR